MLGIIAPHPPIIIPQIGKKEIKKIAKTVQAFLALNQEIVRDPPDTFIIISPHGLIDPSHITLRHPDKKILEGGFSDFGAPEVRLAFHEDASLTEKILDTPGFPGIASNHDHLDHGALVPLFFLTQRVPQAKLVSLTISYNSPKTHFEAGKILQKTLIDDDKKIVFIASGDLSHRLIPTAPSGYSPQGKKFDTLIQKIIKTGDSQRLIELDGFFAEEAGECGLRSIAFLMGLFHQSEAQQKILSYEGPFGVGYLTVIFK